MKKIITKVKCPCCGNQEKFTYVHVAFIHRWIDRISEGLGAYTCEQCGIVICTGVHTQDGRLFKPSSITEIEIDVPVQDGELSIADEDGRLSLK